MKTKNNIAAKVIVLLVVETVVVATIIFFAVRAQKIGLNTVLVIAGFMGGFGGFLFVYSLSKAKKAKREIEKLDKGKKLATAICYPLKDKTREWIMTLGVLVVGSVAIVIGMVQHITTKNPDIGSMSPLLSFLWIPFWFIAVSMKRSYEIYEKGIVFGVRFIEWEKVKGYKKTNGKVMVFLDTLPKRIILRDEKGEVSKILEKYATEL